MDIDYSTEGAGFTGVAKGFGEGLRAFKAEQEKEEQRAYIDAARKIEFEADLQKMQTAHQWDTEKMLLRGKIDFEREEQVRQRKLNDIDNALTQVDKEISAGRLSDEEAYPLKLKIGLERHDIDVPSSILPKSHDNQFGMKPHWVEWLLPQFEGTPEQAYAKDKLASANRDNVQAKPWWLAPNMVGTKAARDYRENVGIELSEQDIRDYQFGQEPKTTQPPEPLLGPRVRNFTMANFDPTTAQKGDVIDNKWVVSRIVNGKPKLILKD